MVRPGTTIEEIRTVASHNHGIAQTRNWIARHLPARGRPGQHLHQRGGRPGGPRGDRRRRLRAAGRRAVRPGDHRRRRRGQRRGRHPLRAPHPARPAPGADRPRPHDAGRHHPEPPRLAARAAHRAGRARDRPHAHRVAPDQGPARRVLVPPRLHRPHRRSRDGGGAGGAAPALRPGALPRLLPPGRERERHGARRRRAGRSRARHRLGGVRGRRALARRPARSGEAPT